MFWKRKSKEDEQVPSVYMYGEIGRDCSALFTLPSSEGAMIHGIAGHIQSYTASTDDDEKIEWLFASHKLLQDNIELTYFDIPYDLRPCGKDMWVMDFLPGFKAPASRLTYFVRGDHVTPCELIFSFDPIYSPIDPSKYLEVYRVEVDDYIGFRNSILEILQVRCSKTDYHEFFGNGLDYLYQKEDS